MLTQSLPLQLLGFCGMMEKEKRRSRNYPTPREKVPPVRKLVAEEECGQKTDGRHNLTDPIKGRIMERNGKLKTNARALRKTMTKEEAHLWYQFLCRT